jgi:hypothetical protein
MSWQQAAGSRQQQAGHTLPATARRPLPAARLVFNLVWQFAIPGVGLLYFAYRDRYDGRPDYVIPWFLFAAMLGAVWSLPILTQKPHQRFTFTMPMWIWPWLALLGVLLYRA